MMCPATKVVLSFPPSGIIIGIPTRLWLYPALPVADSSQDMPTMMPYRRHHPHRQQSCSAHLGRGRLELPLPGPHDTLDLALHVHRDRDKGLLVQVCNHRNKEKTRLLNPFSKFPIRPNVCHYGRAPPVSPPPSTWSSHDFCKRL